MARAFLASPAPMRGIGERLARSYQFLDASWTPATGRPWWVPAGIFLFRASYLGSAREEDLVEIAIGLADRRILRRLAEAIERFGLVPDAPEAWPMMPEVWPRSRTELGRERINKYLANNRDGRSEGKARRGSVDKASGRLRPGLLSADRFVESHLDFLGARPYRAAVFVQALSRWLDFTAERALLPADDAGSVQRALARQWRDLADLLDRYVYDAVMVRDVRDAAELARS